MPLSMHEVQQASRHAHGHRHGLNRADPRGASPLMRSSPGSVSSVSAGTVLHSNDGGTEIEQDYVHLEVCSSCGDVRVFLHFSARE
jgi:photosystem II stability/assembly factor-like uncharacterized protein